MRRCWGRDWRVGWMDRDVLPLIDVSVGLRGEEFRVYVD